MQDEANPGVDPGTAEDKVRARLDVFDASGLLKTSSDAELIAERMRGLANIAATQTEEIHGIRAEIDAQLIAGTEAARALQQLVEECKKLLVDGTSLFATALSASQESATVSSQALADLQSVHAALANANDVISQLNATGEGIEQTASLVATKSAHIEEGRIHADDVRSKLDDLLAQSQFAASEAEAQQVLARETTNGVNELFTSAQAIAKKIQEHAGSVEALMTQCQTHSATAAHLAAIAKSTEQNVKEYEERLAELEAVCSDRLKTIESLLPGATSAGLASAFAKRSATFNRPAIIWQVVFVGSLFGLLGLAMWGPWPLVGATEEPDWSKVLRSLVNRLPFLIPLVWLAIHAARQASLAKRMEEEYAFKATISSSFEGYRRQMSEIADDLSPDSPIGRLCSDTLRTIGCAPGRIYDKHRLDPNPGTLAVETVTPFAEKLAKAKE